MTDINLKELKKRIITTTICAIIGGILIALAPLIWTWGWEYLPKLFS